MAAGTNLQPFQSVKKAANRQKDDFLMVCCFLFYGFAKRLYIDSQKPAKPCAARLFDLLRKMISTVHTYADELILLVFAPFLNSDSLSKNKFFDRL